MSVHASACKCGPFLRASFRDSERYNEAITGKNRLGEASRGEQKKMPKSPRGTLERRHAVLQAQKKKQKDQNGQVR